MFTAYVRGETIDDLAAQYGLKQTSVRAILTTERQRIALSPEPEYRDFREQFEPEAYLLGPPSSRLPSKR